MTLPSFGSDPRETRSTAPPSLVTPRIVAATASRNARQASAKGGRARQRSLPATAWLPLSAASTVVALHRLASLAWAQFTDAGPSADLGTPSVFSGSLWKMRRALTFRVRAIFGVSFLLAAPPGVVRLLWENRAASFDGFSWAIAMNYEDPSGTFPSPGVIVADCVHAAHWVEHPVHLGRLQHAADCGISVQPQRAIIGGRECDAGGAAGRDRMSAVLIAVVWWITLISVVVGPIRCIPRSRYWCW
jgi:hypothetical protein